MLYPGALTSFTATSGGNTLTSSGSGCNGILIDNDLYGKDDYFVILDSQTSEVYLDLRSNDLSLFPSTALPSSLPALSSFPGAFFRVRTMGAGGGYAYAQGRLDSFSVGPAFLGSAGCCMG
jgi:hypothetical protein